MSYLNTSSTDITGRGGDSLGSFEGGMRVTVPAAGAEHLMDACNMAGFQRLWSAETCSSDAACTSLDAFDAARFLCNSPTASQELPVPGDLQQLSHSSLDAGVPMLEQQDTHMADLPCSAVLHPPAPRMVPYWLPGMACGSSGTSNTPDYQDVGRQGNPGDITTLYASSQGAEGGGGPSASEGERDSSPFKRKVHWGPAAAGEGGEADTQVQGQGLSPQDRRRLRRRVTNRASAQRMREKRELELGSAQDQARVLREENRVLQEYVSELEKSHKHLGAELASWQRRWRTTASNNMRLMQVLLGSIDAPVPPHLLARSLPEQGLPPLPPPRTQGDGSPLSHGSGSSAPASTRSFSTSTQGPVADLGPLAAAAATVPPPGRSRSMSPAPQPLALARSASAGTPQSLGAAQLSELEAGIAHAVSFGHAGGASLPRQHSMPLPYSQELHDALALICRSDPTLDAGV